MSGWTSTDEGSETGHGERPRAHPRVRTSRGGGAKEGRRGACLSVAWGSYIQIHDEDDARVRQGFL